MYLSFLSLFSTLLISSHSHSLYRPILSLIRVLASGEKKLKKYNGYFLKTTSA